MSLKYPFPVKYSEVHPGVQLAWCDEGEGEETLLFIHGLAGYLPLWKYQIRELSQLYRCVALDLPGNGLSPAGDFPYSLFFYAEAVARFIEKEKLKKVILCGHSMGGHISIVLTLRYPHLIDQLVLVAPSGLEAFAPHEAMMIQHFMDMGQYFYSNSSQVENTIRQSFYAENRETGEIISDIHRMIRFQSVQKWNRMINASIRSMLNEQVGSFLATLELPVLIVFGEKDEFIPNKLIHPLSSTRTIGEEGAKKMKHASAHFLKKAGHFVHIEKFREVNDLITDFVASGSGKPENGSV